MAYRALWWLGTLLDSLAILVTLNWRPVLQQALWSVCTQRCILPLATAEERLLCCPAVYDAPQLC